VSPGADDPLNLNEVAAQADVHYQTAYRWVRSRQLNATVVAGQYRITSQDLADFLRAKNTPTRPQPPGRRRLDRAAAKMHELLVSGEELEARQLARTIVAEDTSIADLIQQVLVPPLRQIGQDWQDGNVSIWLEHRASAVTEAILGEVAPRPRGRRRGTVAVASVEGDRHSLATMMAAVALRDNNWFVHHLGADLPPNELVQFCGGHDVDVAVVTLVNPDCGDLAHATADRLRSIDIPAVVGGPGRTLEELLHLVHDAHKDIARSTKTAR
jgi:methanogenic corrinoid protein MtbC1